MIAKMENLYFWFALELGGGNKRTRRTSACKAMSALFDINKRVSFALSLSTHSAVHTWSPYTLQLANLTSRKPSTCQKCSYVWNLQWGSLSPRNTPSFIPFSLSSRSPRSLRSFSLFMMYHKVLTKTIFPTRKPKP